MRVRQILKSFTLDDYINALEMVGGLDHSVYLDRSVGHSDSVRFKKIAGPVMGKTIALNVIGMADQVDLDLMMNAAAQFAGS